MCNLTSCKLKRKLKKSRSEWRLNPWPVTLDSGVKKLKIIVEIPFSEMYSTQFMKGGG